MSLSREQILKEAENLPLPQHWALASPLMSQIDADPSWRPEPEEYFDALDRRLEEYRADPSKETDWETVKARILSRNGAA